MLVWNSYDRLKQDKAYTSLCIRHHQSLRWLEQHPQEVLDPIVIVERRGAMHPVHQNYLVAGTTVASCEALFNFSTFLTRNVQCLVNTDIVVVVPTGVALV